jgi:hypothetical protein
MRAVVIAFEDPSTWWLFSQAISHCIPREYRNISHGTHHPLKGEWKVKLVQTNYDS